ncbi:unnamed protein product, partial [Adineta steineri]
SSTSLHFGQLIWAKLASAPFWPAVIFTEENQDWICHKGKSTYVHVFFFGETAERSWIRTTRVLPFIGTEKFSKQRSKWRRKMKTKMEWWYWDDPIESESSIERSPQETTIDDDDDTPILTQDQENYTEEILQLFSTNPDELDDIICLSDNDIESPLKHTSSVCFHPLTSYEEETIIREMISSSNNSFSACRCVAEKEYLHCIRKTFPSTSIISEHWFYLFVFRHCERLTKIFPHWINQMETLLLEPPFISPIHISQMKSLIILFKQYYNSNQQ